MSASSPQTNGDSGFSPEERSALDLWSAVRPPADIAARVMARQVQRQRRRRRVVAVAAAASLLAALGVATWLLRRGPAGHHGSRDVVARETLRLGGRAVAVAEAGARLRWRVGSRGEAEVHQPSGDVFYRVSSGGLFRVHTPQGTVKVLGTCFRVVADAVGQTLVTVYEGRVAAQSGDTAAQVLAAGDRARLDGLTLAQRLRGSPSSAAAPTLPVSRPASRQASSSPALPTLRRKLDVLEREVAALRRELGRVRGKARKTKVLDLDKKELAAMAKRCELRWDMPPLSADKPPSVSPKRSEALGLNETEVKAVEKVLVAHYRRMVKTLRGLYVEVTNDEQNAAALSPWSLISEIRGKSPRAEVKAVFARLARERAGLVTKPAVKRRMSPVERLMRMLTTVGDRVEKDMGAQIGPDLARRYRRFGGGLGSASRSSYGCPKR